LSSRAGQIASYLSTVQSTGTIILGIVLVRKSRGLGLNTAEEIVGVSY
jgi:hypothetical protein